MKFALIVLLPILACAQTEYFPLHVGNQWMYRVSGRAAGDVVLLDITGSQAIDGREYAALRGLPEGPALLRMASDGVLYSYNQSTKQDEGWAAFGTAEGESYNTAITPCNKVARIASRNSTAKVPAGEFIGALAIAYAPGGCADAGLTSELYLPYIGLVERTATTIAGPVTMRLAYARVGGVTVLSEPERTFSLTLDRAVYDTGQITARFTLRNTQSAALELLFSTGQRYDLVIRNENNREVYRWSLGKFFTQVLGRESIGPGERNWVLQVPVDRLDDGGYVAEVFLTNTGPRAWSASVPFEVKHGR